MDGDGIWQPSPGVGRTSQPASPLQVPHDGHHYHRVYHSDEVLCEAAGPLQTELAQLNEEKAALLELKREKEVPPPRTPSFTCLHTPAHAFACLRTPAYACIRLHTPPHACMRLHVPA